MKRALSLALCAMMTVGNLPSVTYASDLSPTDTGVVSQAEEADGKQSAEEAAQAYLKENFINGAKKVITNGGNSVVKSTDSLTYNIGLKTPSGSVIDALRLLTVSSSSNYVGGWYIEENDYLSYPSGGTPASPGRLSITRPTVNTPIKVTLKLFAKDTDTATINDGTATALATQDFTFILEAAEVEYKMQVAVQDKDKNPITDASITVEKDGWDKVTPASDGSYKMANGASYKLTVKKEGYTDYSETFTYTGNSEEPVFLKTVTLSPIMMQNIRFSVKDKASGAEISGAAAASSGSAGSASAVSGFSACSGTDSACCSCAVLSAVCSGAVAVLSAAGVGSAGAVCCGASAVMWGTTAPTVKVSGCADSRVAAPAPPTARTSAMVSAAMAVTALRRAVPDRSNRFFIYCLCLRISRWCSAVLHRVFAPCPGRVRFYSTPPMRL